MKVPYEIVRYAGFAGIATGLAIGTAWGKRDVRQSVPRVTALEQRLVSDPFRGLTHAGMLLAARQASAKLEDGRPWAAWNELREFVEDESDVPPSVAILASRAAAGWDGWSHVRRLLSGREWLADEDGGAALLLLARAEEERGEWGAAAVAYRRYLPGATGEARGMASARLGRALSEAGRPAEAAQAFAQAAGALPAAADWMAALRAEALVKSGARAAALAGTGVGAAPARARLARAEARLWLAGGDTVSAVERLENEARALAPADAVLAAGLSLERARLLAKSGRGAEARDAARAVAADPGAAPADRARAAALLDGLPGERTVDEETARAAAYEAAGKPGLAAKALRAAVARGLAETPELRLRIGRLLFDAADYGPARAWLSQAVETLPDSERVAEAELYAGRALVRAGKGADGWAAIRRVAERRAGTAASGSAWFLLGDEAKDRATGIIRYRRAAAVASSPDAREALFRVGDRALKEGDGAGAARAWEEYVERYPRGDQTAEAAYRAGVVHERAGRAERARAMYAAAIAADPVAYHAVRAADRLGADPLAAAGRARGWDGGPADSAAAAGVLRRLRLLEEAGLDDAWKDELASARRRLDARPLALLHLAEGVRDDGHAIDGIRIGRALLERRGGEWDARLLRVVFPLPYRELLLAEAERADVDPWLLAGLVRQESSFNPRARSWVGATGLSQIMPATGAWLAPGAGVRNFEPSLLTVPEINLRMGSRYLRDQLKRYRGARDLALSAYNAGPSRADRWKRELGHGGDVDAFREKIPFTETRHYVKVVIRNAEVYRRLYGPERSPGLAAPGR